MWKAGNWGTGEYHGILEWPDSGFACVLQRRLGINRDLGRSVYFHVQYIPETLLISVIAIGLGAYVSFIDWEKEVDKVTKRIEGEDL
jgi:hypothetical protein